MGKHVPPIYPQPDPVHIGTLVVVDVDVASKTITVAGEPPAELKELAERERWRMDLNARVAQYTATCLTRVLPHFGERPKYLTPEKWNDIEQRVRLLQRLPAEAPEYARLAFMAIQTLNRLADELVAAGDYSEHIERALCCALDLGQLLERGQAQIDIGATVDSGRRSKRAVKTASQAKQDLTHSKSELAREEFDRRMQGSKNARMKTSTLKNMAQLKDSEGRYIYGSLRTLIKFSNGWK